MKNAFTIFCSFALLAMAAIAPSAPASAQQVAGIAAVVNDDAISMADVKDRMVLVMVSSGLPNNEDIRNRILPQILESLIEEQLKLQEATRHGVAISDEAVEEGFATIAQQNNFTADQFRAAMKQAGVPIGTLTRQIRAQLAWNEYVLKALRGRVDVRETDYEERLARIKDKIGQTEYLVAEIYLPVDDAKRSDEVQQFARRLSSELQAKKAPFGAVAAQFSKGAGAEKGGSLGWVQAGQLAPELDAVILKLEEGGVSDPVRIGEAVHIMTVQKKRTLSEDTIPSREEIMNAIGFERLDRVQQRALLDLKSAAFIDRRL